MKSADTARGLLKSRLISVKKTKKSTKKVEIVLMHDAAWWSQTNGKGKDLVAAAPDNDMDLESRMRKLVPSLPQILSQHFSQKCHFIRVFQGYI